MNIDAIFRIVAEIYFIVYLLCITVPFFIFIRPLFVKKWTVFIVAISYFLTMIVLDHIPYTLSHFTAYLLGNMVAFIVMITIERGNIAAKFLYSSLFFAVRWLLPSIFNTIETYTVLDWLLTQSTPYALVLVWTVEYACLFGCFLIICKTLHRSLTMIQLTMRSAFILCIPACVSSMSYFLVKTWQIEPPTSQVELVLFLYYVALLCILLVFVRIYAEQERAKVALAQQSSLHTQLQMTKQHVTYIEELYDELKGLKHDLGNHFEVLGQLMKQNDTENAQHYMAYIQKEAASLATLSTGHPVTDVILQQKRQQAAQHQIELQSSFYFPKQLQIEPFDMSIVLNNLLDNAIDATKRCDIKSISIRCSRQNDVFLIRIENPISTKLQIDTRTGLPLSTKSSSLHGIGLLNVQATLQKYGGHLTFHEKDGFLIVTALLVDHS